MKITSITTKLLVFITAAFVITTVSVLYIADKQLIHIIDKSQKALYSEKVDTIYKFLARNNARLKKTGMEEAYIEDFQEASLKALRQDHYKTDKKMMIYPFILDYDGMIIMHPLLPYGDLSVSQLDIVKKLLSSGNEGGFDYDYLGDKKWCRFKKFPDWNWIIGYAVPLDIKYADAREFLTSLVYIMGGVALVAILFLSLIVARFTKPITRLTRIATRMADGDLDQQIGMAGADEVGTLASSFSNMRDAIRQKIQELEDENREREKAETELAAEKERLSVTLRSIGDGVITTDVSGRVIFLNKVAEGITGWPNSEAATRPIGEVFHTINTKSRERPDYSILQIINNGRIIESRDLILINRDGREINITSNGAPILNAESEIIGAVLVFRDTTEFIKTEKELLKVTKLESVGILAGGIAHDFNNILAAILGNINLALFDKTVQKKTRTLLTAAEKASLRAKDLTQQLLTFARGGDPVKEVSSLDAVIRDSANFVLHGDKVACRFIIPDDLWLVEIDKGQISQVIQNIVINGSHAMPDGGTITITAENVPNGNHPFPATVREEKFVRISIEDHGIGMSPQIMEKIFDPYYSTKKEGSGLGLAITQSIILKHNGHISVDSSPGSGSTFTIFLPASQETRTVSHENVVTSAQPYHAKILLMDDEEMVLQVSKDMLSLLGHEVTLSRHGEEAIQFYREAMEAGEVFDIVIMDLTIPGGMGGKDTVKEILALDPTARVVVSSGYSNDPVMAKYAEYGFCAALVKPYILKELSRTINELTA